MGTIFDIALVIPYILATDASQDILSYYSNPLFWITLLLILATTSSVGWYLANKRKKK